MVKSLVSKLSSASSTLSIATSFSSSHSKHDTTAAASTAISGDNYLKYRNDPGRFFGDGVQFKAKLIGILEVGEARGDRMCQEALQDLKMAIRAAGEHKQRITIHVTIDGLRLRDEKTGDSLYHHPVHKISFIAQDMTDSRAFGYIFGSPDSGHRFFGIKTDKAASQVVLAMRDLFQVVFELKKKEIELARQQIQSKTLHHHDQHQLASLSSLKSAAASGANDLSGLGGGSATSAATLSMLNNMVSSSTNTPNASRLGVNLDSKGASKEISPESVADLVDLEQELSSLQRGITQMERITPNDGHSQHSSLPITNSKLSTSVGNGGGGGAADPFGDSFTSFPTLPPPEPGRLRSKTTPKSNDITSTSSTNAQNASLLSPSATQSRLSPVSSTTTAPATAASSSIATIQPLDVDDDDNWLRELDAHSDVFDTSKTVVPGLMGMPPLASSLSSGVTLTSRAPLAPRESSDTPPNHIYETVSCSTTNVMADMSELSHASNTDNTNNLANSSSLSDIFQSAAEAVQNSKLDIKSDAFTDLDPLGIGRTRPYVDKKYFFQELKNPPKKVLKDLTATTNTSTSGTATATAATTITSMADNQSNTTITLTDDILNLNYIELKSQPQFQQQPQQHHHHHHPPPLHHNQQQQQHQLQQQQITSTNINSLLTTTSYSPATTELATLTTATVYSHASPLTTTINNSTALANLNVSSNTDTASTSLICTCPTSIIVTCTTTNASTNRFTNNSGNNNSNISNNNSNLLTHQTNNNNNNNNNNNSNNIIMNVGSVVGGEGGQSHILAAIKSAASTTTKLTSSSSSTQPQASSINQTNTLRFSRYPPLEPVMAPIANDPVLLPRDTDPFSPTRKKSDPFEEGGDIFSKLDPFEFEFNSSTERPIGEDKIRKPNLSSPSIDVDAATVSAAHTPQDILSGPLQVSLPPEGGDVVQTISTVRSRPVPSTMGSMNAAQTGGALPPASMLRQQTADVISSISNKKMPHLFGQSSRFSKRDSNNINMRRLQESDSLSETETAPEPPPRPDSASYAEPPPLPPKKQFNDIIIRPRANSSSLSMNSANRYDSLNSALTTKIGSSTTRPSSAMSADVPPIPLPSRRVGRTDGSYPGPGRPRKPGHTEDDYLAPLSIIHSSSTTSSGSAVNATMPDVPPLLPPPTQTSSRSRTQRQHSLNRPHDIYENKNEILQQQLQQQLQQKQQQQQQQQQRTSETPPIVPDITLSQLLTLGIDDLALKLNVPISKLSTMTLVELTSYLSEFLEQSKPRTDNKMEILSSSVSRDEPPQHTPPIFKVNFDQEATFVAKFDDTFGEDFHQTSSSSATEFEANFAQFDCVNVEPPVQAINQNSVPPADRYAVFREIIDQELQQQQEEVDLIGDVMEAEDIMQNDEQRFETTNNIVDFDMNNLTHQQPDLLSGDMLEVTSGPQPTTIDTKISEVLAQAKDRYAALRDLILVENLFDKPPPQVPARNGIELVESLHSETKSPFQGFSGFNDDEDDQDLRQLMDQASTLDSTTQQQRLGLVDSRGFLVEPSSSAITVEEDEDEEEEEEDEDRRHRRNTREDNGGLSSGDSNGDKERDKGHMPISKYEQLASSNQQLEELEDKREVKYEEPPKISISQIQSNNDSKYLSVASVASSGLSGSKDDLEIDDLMHRAISNLSLDSKERNSPAMQAQQNTTTTMTPPHFNDVSTSPMPLQRSPVVGGSSIISQNKSPNNRSPQQISPLPPTLTAVSQLIDVVTKQIEGDVVSKTSNDSWATFDTPQHQPSVPAVSSDKRARPSAKNLTKATNFLNLPPPPGSTSNCSQNDSAIESPCSSDPRDEAWHKHTMGGSSLSLGHHTTAVGSSSAQRRYHKKERQNTSSSSRDLSWDEDQVGGSGGGVSGVGPPHIMDYPQSKRLSGQSQGSLTTDRHGYYRRHARRMNSCDEDYDYEQDYVASRREQPCKYKHSLSRSRDNFDMESPGWYHHHGGGVQHPHHTWSSQDIEQSRGRTFDRAAYERTTYGPPIYDKRGVGPPLAPTTSYDRRSGGGVYDKRSKYYRGDSNPRSSNADRIYNLDDFDQMLAASGKIPPHLASMYEEMKADCCSPPMALHQRQRAADFMYERERKSFDRESLESYEGSNIAPRRRRRSYDSGGVPSDPYGSCDSREDYHRERCVMTADKSRSLRKSLKSLRVSGDIDYDQDSEKDYHYRDQRSRCDTRSLQRPSQLSTQGISVVGGTSANVLGSQSRIRKSSGSSPWDGEEPTLPGQKTSSSSWKRPSSAAEAERRLAENRRAAVKGQTPSGSDEDKDRRYRKKRGSRNKDLPAINSGGRYRNSNYDYISCEDLDDDAEDYVDEEEEEDRGIEDDEISPPDEDKFARLEMRRHEMHNRMMDAHVRRRKDVAPSQTSQTSSMAYRRGGKATTYARRPLPPPTEPKHPQDYGYDDDDGEYEQTPTPRSNTSSALPTATPNTNTKFSFDIGFESDFNQSSPPPAPAGTASSCTSTPAANVSAANTPASKSSFRFSNDFSAGQEREKQQQQHPPTTGSLQQYDLENRGISPQTATTQTSTPKLRFDDNVKVSQFDDAFEDDFSKATFEAFQNDDDQWQETTVAVQKTSKQQIRNNKLQQRQQDLIRKSESVNIFAKKVEDPFEDDEFFNSPPTTQIQNSASNDKPENHKTTSNGGGNNGNNTAGNHGNNNGNNFQSQNWDDDNTNFAKFDENM